jgi:hypothetical protein
LKFIERKRKISTKKKENKEKENEEKENNEKKRKIEFEFFFENKNLKIATVDIFKLIDNKKLNTNNIQHNFEIDNLKKFFKLIFEKNNFFIIFEENTKKYKMNKKEIKNEETIMKFSFINFKKKISQFIKITRYKQKKFENIKNLEINSSIFFENLEEFKKEYENFITLNLEIINSNVLNKSSIKSIEKKLYQTNKNLKIDNFNDFNFSHLFNFSNLDNFEIILQKIDLNLLRKSMDYFFQND